MKAYFGGFLCCLIVVLALAGNNMEARAESLAPMVAAVDARQPQLPEVVAVRSVYLTIVNSSASSLKIVAVRSPAFESIEIHRTQVSDGLVSMSAVTAVAVPAQGRVLFSPEGLHLMALGPKKYYVIGERYPMTVYFENDQVLLVEVLVVAPNFVAQDCTYCAPEREAVHVHESLQHHE